MRVLSVGHSNLASDVFLALLRDAGVRVLADVRRVPFSRRFPWFGRERLAASLQEAGIAYLWLGDGLGGRKRPEAARSEAKPNEDQRTDPARTRDASRNAALRDPALRAYADAQDAPAFRRDLAALLEQAARAPTAVMCAERDWRQCHRQILADVLVAAGCEVVHVSRAAPPETHALSPLSRVEGERVSYPALL